LMIYIALVTNQPDSGTKREMISDNIAHVKLNRHENLR